MNCAFLGLMIPQKLKKEVMSLSSHNMQDAADALQWHFYEGLCKNLNDGIYIINTLPVGSYPQYYKKPFLKSSNFSTKYKRQNLNVGFCNIKLIRNYFLSQKIEKALFEWCVENEDNRVVFMYTLSAAFLKAIEKVKKKVPSLKVCAIVADLPNMASLSSTDGFWLKLFRKYVSDSAYSKINLVDMFVLLTKQMADYMRITQPYCVVEGIATSSKTMPDFSLNSSEKRTILYTGTLHRRFGISNLIEAFNLIKDERYELVLCGIGDLEKEIIYAASKNARIRYLGQKPRSEILQLQKKASVLVNPRQNNEVFTKYSFPSKNLEYLSSGRPLVAYKLDGIPDEYDKYIYYVEDNTVETLAQKLVEICEMPDEQLKKHCQDAYFFVQTKKNDVEQTKIILKLLKEIM